MAKKLTRTSKTSWTNTVSSTLKTLMIFALKLFTKLILVPALFLLMVWVMLIWSVDTNVSKWVYFIFLLIVFGGLIHLRKKPVSWPKSFSTKWDRYLLGAKVLQIYIIITILGMVVISFLSYQFYQAKNANYSFKGQNLTAGNLMEFYFYETLDMIPVIDILQTLKISKPVAANHGWASWLLLIYKVFFIFLVSASIIKWFKKNFAKKEKANET